MSVGGKGNICPGLERPWVNVAFVFCTGKSGAVT